MPVSLAVFFAQGSQEEPVGHESHYVQKQGQAHREWSQCGTLWGLHLWKRKLVELNRKSFLIQSARKRLTAFNNIWIHVLSRLILYREGVLDVTVSLSPHCGLQRHQTLHSLYSDHEDMFTQNICNGTGLKEHWFRNNLGFSFKHQCCFLEF